MESTKRSFDWSKFIPALLDYCRPQGYVLCLLQKNHKRNVRRFYESKRETLLQQNLQIKGWY